MRTIVRHCAGCHAKGIRTELANQQDEVTIIVGKFGAHTDLCADCQATLLEPVLQAMATGVDLSELTLAEWAKLGTQVPKLRAAARRTDKPEPAAEAPGPEKTYTCTGCGRQFHSASAYGGHRSRFGDSPHTAEIPVRKRRRRASAPAHTQTSQPEAEAGPGQAAAESASTAAQASPKLMSAAA
ncbi:MAG TPA: hypothetical protein DGG94_14240 [Micromonosporaceae bacterium]|nr:hypothetical protein [Micromonosporaceae bacterium]HCU50935.1 hypothetical protein [Micromonosporaceae bacterium]